VNCACTGFTNAGQAPHLSTMYWTVLSIASRVQSWYLIFGWLRISSITWGLYGALLRSTQLSSVAKCAPRRYRIW
jgi:hypothetical protein